MNGITEEKTSAPPKGGSNLWKQLIALVLAAGLLWLSFRNANFAEVWTYAQQADPIYMLLVAVTAVISHLLRAWRWIYLLQPLTDKKISLWNSFCAVIIGYAVNIAIPRGGEVARLLSISKSENLPWMGVLPTMFIDRMLDLAMLGLLLGMTLTQLPKELLDKNPLFVPGGIVITICSIVGLFVLPYLSKAIKMALEMPVINSKLPEKISGALDGLAKQFEVGTKGMTNPKSWLPIGLLSIAIWGFYWSNYYLMVLAFHLQDKVSPLQTLVVFTIGTIGVLIPTPGSAGTYHYFNKMALMLTCGLEENQALAFVTVLHILCFILAVCIPAAICYFIQQQTLNKAKS